MPSSPSSLRLIVLLIPILSCFSDTSDGDTTGTSGTTSADSSGADSSGASSDDLTGSAGPTSDTSTSSTSEASASSESSTEESSTGESSTEESSTGEPGHMCCEMTIFPGCGDAMIEACVCAVSQYCCDSTWDGVCVQTGIDLGCMVCP